MTSNIAWTAVASPSWIAITAGASGSNNETIAYSVAAKGTCAAKAGTISVNASSPTSPIFRLASPQVQ